MSWWVRELRVLASIPIIILFGGLLSALLTMIFVFEAFVTELYEGPGKQLIVSIVHSKPISYNLYLYVRPFRPLYFSSF